MVFEAIAKCVPVVAGLVQSVDFSAPAMVSGHSVRLPIEVVEGWMRTPREHQARALAHAARAREGDFWRAQNLASSVRSHLGVLDELAAHGLGEGAGYKVLTRSSPTGGQEHVMLALLTARGDRFSPEHGDRLRRLAPSIHKAMERIAVPLIASRPLAAQMMEETEVGYVAVTRAGTIREINRRAYELIHLYAPATDVGRERDFLARFVGAARARAARGRPWVITRARLTLEVRVHALDPGVHHLPEPMLLLTLCEQKLQEEALPSGRFPELSLRLREITDLLVNTGLSYADIGRALQISSGTVRAQVPKIYRAHKVANRSGLAALYHAHRLRR